VRVSDSIEQRHHRPLAALDVGRDSNITPSYFFLSRAPRATCRVAGCGCGGRSTRIRGTLRAGRAREPQRHPSSVS
jgi:hypothetical protein